MSSSLLSPPTESAPPVSLTSLAAEIKMIMAEHTAAVAACRTSLDHAHRVGDLLEQCKAQVRAELGPGQWLPWLAQLLAGTNLSLQMAKIYMRIARNWHRLPELQNRYPSTHYDISWFRKALRKAKNNEPNDDDEDGADDQDDDDLDDDADADDLAGGGCGGDGSAGDGTDTDTSNQPVTLPLSFTVATLAKFKQQVRELAMHLDSDEHNFSDRLSSVIARVHAALIPNDTTTQHNDTEAGHARANDSAH